MNKTNEPNLDLLYIGFLLAIVWMLVGCVSKDLYCDDIFVPGEEYTVKVESKVDLEYIKLGLSYWDLLGYRYKVWEPGDKNPRITINRLSDEEWVTLLGKTVLDPGMTYVSVAPTSGPEVVAHEFGHVSGIIRHIQPHEAEEKCNLMNSILCLPITRLTNLDVKLWDTKSWHCEDKYANQ